MYSEKGQSLMELVIVIAVMVIVIGALVFATIASLRNAQFAKNQAQATKLAQEGLEWVRTGRDRNACIGDLRPYEDVNSWNGNNSNCSGVTSIWGYHISGSIEANNCDYVLSPPKKCYFTIKNDGSLSNALSSSAFPLGITAESILPNFKRVVTLSDDPSDPLAYKAQKTVTAIVTWTDFSGEHKSQLTTILRRI